MALFTTADGWLFFMRWFHFLAGITWIGMLYYFNFVQTQFFASADPPVRSGMIVGSLVGRALWWFRWGAMITFLTGWIILFHKMALLGGLRGFFSTSYGWAIFTGSTLGSIMWANVWFIIWPAQKVVIESATRVSKGGQAIPEAAARGQRAGIASRTNTLFSIPMLFFMGAASHLALFSSGTRTAKVSMLVIGGLILLLVELNALFGTTGPAKKPLTTLTGTFWAGFILTAVLWGLYVVLFPQA
jgi:uncharacterized membrane protein